MIYLAIANSYYIVSMVFRWFYPTISLMVPKFTVPTKNWPRVCARLRKADWNRNSSPTSRNSVHKSMGKRGIVIRCQWRSYALPRVNSPYESMLYYNTIFLYNTNKLYGGSAPLQLKSIIKPDFIIYVSIAHFKLDMII